MGTSLPSRTAGTLLVVAGLLNAVSGVVVQGVVQPASDVSDELFSYPWTGTGLVISSLVYAVIDVLLLAGLVGYLRSGAAPGRAGRAGILTAAAGTAVLIVAQLASLSMKDATMDDATPVILLFVAGSLLSAVGFLVAGVATARGGRWDGWHRYVTLALGVWLVVMIGLQMTPLLAVSVAVYGLLTAAVGVALRQDGAPVRRSTAVQV